MKEFIYKAYSDDGSIIEDSLQAESRREAAQEIFARELHLIHLEEKKAPSSISFFRKPFSSRRKLALFAEEWASLLDAGLTITDSLALLEKQMDQREGHVISSIRKTISSGHGVGKVLPALPVFRLSFSPYFL